MSFGEISNVLHVLAIIAVIVFLLLIAVANFFIDFAFNPKAPITMKTLMLKGALNDLDMSDYDMNKTVGMKEALEWFDGAKKSFSYIAQDGTELFGWEFRPEESISHQYIILCHGYTGDPTDLANYAQRFYQKGFIVLLPAARAHERNISTGYIQMGYQDSKDLVDLTNKLVEEDPKARIVYLGTSMGGAEVMMASGWDLPSNVVCIIDDCGYTGVWEELSLQLKNLFKIPTFPVLNITSFFNRVRAGYSFEEASALTQLSKATVPMLFIHGTDDEFVPFSMLQKNYDACASKEKRMLAIEGAGHCLSSRVNPQLYWSVVDEFIDSRI